MFGADVRLTRQRRINRLNAIHEICGLYSGANTLPANFTGDVARRVTLE